MSKMRLGMHEEKWNIWNGIRAWGSSTSHDTAHRHGGQTQAMTQHSTRAWSQAQGMTQHAIHGVKRKT